MICPNCHQEGFSKWDTFGMAPLNPKTCKNCHKSIKPKFFPFMISMLIVNISVIFVILFALEIAFNYLELNLYSGSILYYFLLLYLYGYGTKYMKNLCH